MKKLIFYSWMILVGLSACQSNQENNSSRKFGIEVSETSAISIKDLEEKIATIDSLNDVTLKGKVVEVCQNAGCWMTLEKTDGTTMRVKFKDYKLFMPKDIAGKEVVIHGKAMKKEIPVDELQHYAADAGKSKEEIGQITKPEVQLSFEADGVLIKG
ncbi:MAG: DUF4920 domain-containing protein [Flammeovirgaceae bacterium]|nr:DUF4920 domain-containing protein [Flammeovirgaceae bacterium]